MIRFNIVIFLLALSFNSGCAYHNTVGHPHSKKNMSCSNKAKKMIKEKRGAGKKYFVDFDRVYNDCTIKSSISNPNKAN